MYGRMFPMDAKTVVTAGHGHSRLSVESSAHFRSFDLSDQFAIEYLMEEGVGRWSGPTELPFTEQNETTETVISHLYSMRHCSGRAGLVTRRSQVDHSAALSR
ncbi:hypothetical protein EVAR_78938_1 [Eumeta japonica]|uniref:Uncharacterized protein n=1 Tax=Eumeta variegata TaxID=151549 RepID=A0A4C1U2Q3_EUMVA|nr:hypothetical protein EVAR_78938_1 [Eumeta japonica]